MPRVCLFAAALLALWIVPKSTQAVIIYQNPHRNFRAPANAWTNSGWQWQGQWGDFLGTAIGSQYFITAKHVGGGVNDTFRLGGRNHVTTAYWTNPSNDLRIFKIADTFSSWAPLYSGNAEVGQAAMIFGRGTARGEPIFIDGQPKGWQWGEADHRQSWGRNAISSVVGTAPASQLLQTVFNEKGMPYESTISAGDSGGGMFIKGPGGWSLAGINYSTDGLVKLTSGGVTVNAALFDRGGLYDSGNAPIADKAANIPGSAYATRISSSLSWINQVLSGALSPNDGTPSSVPGNGISVGKEVPEPSGAFVVGGVSMIALRRRRRAALSRNQPMSMS